MRPPDSKLVLSNQGQMYMTAMAANMESIAPLVATSIPTWPARARQSLWHRQAGRVYIWKYSQKKYKDYEQSDEYIPYIKDKYDDTHGKNQGPTYTDYAHKKSKDY